MWGGSSPPSPTKLLTIIKLLTNLIIMSQIEPNLIDALLTMGISIEEIKASYAQFINDLKKEGGDDE